MADGATLGEFLKARRATLDPADFGLTRSSRRRVPGLRREEVAALAGISADYYLRIEQGRIERPSDQVLNSLARVMRFDEASSSHLRRLARPDEPVPSHESLAPAIRTLIDQLSLPAFIVNRYLDCLASNALARSLSPGFSAGRNLLRQLFLDPTERAFHLDWDDTAVSVVGGLRQVAGTAPSDERLTTLVDGLAAESDEFRELWSRAYVGYRTSGESRVSHPRVGELHLHRQRFDIPGPGGMHLQVYYADPGSDSARNLARLADEATPSPTSGR